MMRGTFANVRLRNQLAPGTEGGWTTYLPGGEVMSIYDASVKYHDAGVPLVVLAGKEYGSGSSRDWAAKGTMLLGVKAVIAESFERIHRSNLVNMGVLPLEFTSGESAASLGLTGREVFDLQGSGAALRASRHGRRARPARRRHRSGVPGPRPDRHARGADGVQARRHPAVRPPAARAVPGMTARPSAFARSASARTLGNRLATTACSRTWLSGLAFAVLATTLSAQPSGQQRPVFRAAPSSSRWTSSFVTGTETPSTG